MHSTQEPANVSNQNSYQSQSEAFNESDVEETDISIENSSQFGEYQSDSDGELGYGFTHLSEDSDSADNSAGEPEYFTDESDTRGQSAYVHDNSQHNSSILTKAKRSLLLT